MPDVTLANGRDLTFDLSKITISEFRLLFDPAQKEHEGDALVGRCAGLSVKEIGALPYPDYRLLMREFFRKAREPFANPNSPSASTSG